MTLEQLDIYGNPFIGVYCRANETHLLHPPGIEKRTVKRMADTLGVEPMRVTVGGSTLVGALLVMNSNGIVVSNMVDADELRGLKKEYNIVRSPERLNACGNNILCNDRAAVVHPGYTKRAVKRFGDALGVEVERGIIAGIKTVGSAAIAVNKGVLCHPKSTQDDLERLRGLFKVNVQIGTANYGSAMVGACMLANTKGAVVGTTSTGIELGRIEDALGYLD